MVYSIVEVDKDVMKCSDTISKMIDKSEDPYMASIKIAIIIVAKILVNFDEDVHKTIANEIAANAIETVKASKRTRH